MKLPLQARILYFYMISIADDHGRFKADGSLLRMAFPYDDFNSEQVSGWREIIEKAGLIKTYEHDNELYAYHPKWKDYQGGRGTNVRPDRKNSTLPTPCQHSANVLPTDCQPIANALPTKSQPTADTDKNRIEKKRVEENRKEKKTIKYLATQSVAGKQPDVINLMIEKFKSVNPSYELLFRRNNQRDAIGRMIKKWGADKVSSMIKVLPTTNSNQYAPTITTPYQLEEKIGSLVSFLNREKNNQPKIIKA